MRLLSLETSGRLGSAALLEAAADGVQLIDERRLPPDRRTARSLLPCVHEMLTSHGWRAADVQAVCTTTGPGSFTGLRIGVVAAKTIAYAAKAHLVGVHTLAAIAAAVEPFENRLWTVLDAQRQELFVARFQPAVPVIEQATPPTEILALDQWLLRVAPGDLAAGPPLARIGPRLPPGALAIDCAKWEPTAAAAGRLAAQLLLRGATIEPLSLVPNYFRHSAAEEKAQRETGRDAGV